MYTQLSAAKLIIITLLTLLLIAFTPIANAYVVVGVGGPVYSYPNGRIVWRPGYWYNGYWVPGRYVEYSYPGPYVGPYGPYGPYPGPGFVWIGGGYGYGGYGGWHRGPGPFVRGPHGGFAHGGFVGGHHR